MTENNDQGKTLWATADKLRSNIDAAEYKHFVLGLIDSGLDKQRLGELIYSIGTIDFSQDVRVSQDLLERVHEYFLGQFADAKGKQGGQFFIPESIVKLLVEMIEAGLVDCMVALHFQLFYNTMIPACLWFLARDRTNHKFRDRSNEILFFDARKLGSMINRRNKELPNTDIAKIAVTYHAWRGEDGVYTDQPGFCKAAKIDNVHTNNYVLMLGRYVGAAEAKDDGMPFDEKMSVLTAQLAEQFARRNELQQHFRENFSGDWI